MSRRRGWRAAPRVALAVILLLGGCGIQGSPVAPEDVGVQARLQREKEQALRERTEQGGQVPADPVTEFNTVLPVPPLEQSVDPAARPSGDVQVQPR